MAAPFDFGLSHILIGMMILKTLRLLATVTVIAGSVSLIACSKPTEVESAESKQPAASTASPTDVAAPADLQPVKITSLLPVQAYDCLPTQKIMATYDQQNPVESQAMLEINGMIHVLYAASATESIYRTDSGMADGEGMTWLVQADGATLSSFPLSADANNSVEKVLYRCTKR